MLGDIDTLLAFIALGSNLQDPKKQIKTAITSLEKDKSIKLISYSSLYISKPFLNMSGPDYLNAVCKIKTELSAIKLLDLCQSIENKQYRVREVRWGSRTIDLDILLFDNKIYNNKRLIIPHPEMINRSFVLLPLYEIEPDLQIPIFGSLEKCLKKIDISEIKKYEDN